ncbi:MAG: MFS transporter [Minisyncoccales bacterium]
MTQRNKEKGMKNIPIMYLLSLFKGLIFFLPILALYFTENLFSLTNVALIFSIESIALVVFEIPTGTLGDFLGRKKTLILSGFVALAGLFFLYFGETMLPFSIYAVLSALAISLNSGTDNALIYDTLQNSKKQKRYNEVVGKYFSIWPFGAAIGAIAGGYLAKISLEFPILITFLPFAIAAILPFFLVEPLYEKPLKKEMFSQIFSSLNAILKNKQLLIIFLGLFLFLGFSSVVSMNPVLFESKSIPIVYFGYLFAAIQVAISAGSYFSHKLSKKVGDKKTIIISTLFFPIVLISALFFSEILFGILFICAFFFFSLKNPSISNLINLEVKSNQRATIISVSSLFSHLGRAIILPLFGYIAGIFTIEYAFFFGGIMLISVPILFLWLKNK